MRLISIPMSHYCDKVRWALERSRIPYVEEGHLQGLHYPHAFRHGGGPFVPVLVTEEVTLSDSTSILKWLDRDARELYPLDLPEVDALAATFDEELGVETRRWVYQASLGRSEFIDYASHGAPRWEKGVFRWLFPLAGAFVRRRLSVNPERVAAGLERVEAIVADVEDRLSDGRRYLLGGRFTAADLTFACMLAPLILPAQYGIPLPPPEFLDGALVNAYRSRPAGKFALRLYAEERQPPRFHPPMQH